MTKQHLFNTTIQSRWTFVALQPHLTPPLSFSNGEPWLRWRLTAYVVVGSPQKLGLLTLLALDNKWVATVKVLHQIIYLFISSFLLLICFFLVFSSRSWSLHIMGLASNPSSLSPFSMPLPSWLLALVSPGGSTPKN